MVRKAKFNKTSIDKLPNDKPVLYRIETDSGNLNYVGIAKRGRVRDRIKEHLQEVPGANVTIEQFDENGENGGQTTFFVFYQPKNFDKLNCLSPPSL